MKIAVIGSGIAGLTASWLFQQANHQVTLYEKQPKIGMGAHTLELEIEDIPGYVDVPLRGFNPENWPNLIGLYKALNLEIEALDLSHSFNTFSRNTILAYHNVEVGQPYQRLWQGKQLLKPTVRRVLSDLMHFKKSAKQDIQQPDYARLTLHAYLASKEYSTEFIYGCLYPALGTICTCSYDSLDNYPVTLIVDFLEHMLGTMGLYRVKGGTQAVVQRLMSDLTDVRCGVTVAEVSSTSDGITVQTTDGVVEQYDHVMVATQANHAWRLLANPRPDELDILQSFPYDPATVVVHTDSRLMPTDVKQWGMINFIDAESHKAAMSTIWMNRVETAWQGKSPIFQTVMPLFEPHPDSIINTSYFERAVVNHQSQQALERLCRLHTEPDRRVWFCGSYASPGIPLLESGVNSSVAVAERLGVYCPW